MCINSYQDYKKACVYINNKRNASSRFYNRVYSAVIRAELNHPEYTY